MKITGKLIAAMALAPAAAFAAGAFDGTWKINSVQQDPETHVLKDGQYTCVTCKPSLTVKADGSEQKIATVPGVDTIAVKILDGHAVQLTSKLNGKVIDVARVTAAADGTTSTVEDTAYRGPKPETIKIHYTRVTAGPAGSHPTSGTWRATSVEGGSALTVQYRITDTGFTMKGSVTSFDAKFDGKPYPITGDPAQGTVSVKRISPTEVEETFIAQGKTVSVERLSVAADGKSIQGTNRQEPSGQTARYTLDKLQ